MDSDDDDDDDDNDGDSCHSSDDDDGPMHKLSLRPWEIASQSHRRLGERKGKGRHARRCRVCANCKREDCGECRSCSDMIKFGGTGTLKKHARNERT